MSGIRVSVLKFHWNLCLKIEGPGTMFPKLTWTYNPYPREKVQSSYESPVRLRKFLSPGFQGLYISANLQCFNWDIFSVDEFECIISASGRMCLIH